MKICNIVRLRLLHALVDILNRKRLYTDKNSNKEDEASLIKKKDYCGALQLKRVCKD